MNKRIEYLDLRYGDWRFGDWRFGVVFASLIIIATISVNIYLKRR